MKGVSKEKAFYKGALVLMLFGFLSKVVGAVYRIPLTSIIGAEGMGLYQMVFPLYTLMLTISSSGLPSSISKLIAESRAKNNFRQANKILKISFVLLISFSLICTLLVFFLAKPIAIVQGNKKATICYLGIAPAIIFVGLISGFRGYFQGEENMFPTAISQFIEQIVKMALGLYFASLFIKKGLNYGVLGAMIGISVSELVAFLYLLIKYVFCSKKRKKQLDLSVGQLTSNREAVKSILSLSIYVTLGGLIMPLTMLIDSSLVINILKNIGFSETVATKLFGLQTGTVGSIINMPVVLSLGIATSILPCVAKNNVKGNMQEVKKSISKAILLTIIFALPASVGLMTFSQQIIRLLYSKSLSTAQIYVASQILEVASFGVFYLAMVQVTAGILQGVSKFFVPLISLSCGAVVKIILNVVLIRIKSVNILGAEVSTVACYIVALIVNLYVLKRQGLLNLDYKIFFVFIFSSFIYLSKYLFNWFLFIKLNYYLSLFMTIFLVLMIYFTLLFILYLMPLKRIKNNKK